MIGYLTKKVRLIVPDGQGKKGLQKTLYLSRISMYNDREYGLTCSLKEEVMNTQEIVESLLVLYLWRIQKQFQ